MHGRLIANPHIVSKDVYINVHMVIVIDNDELLIVLLIIDIDLMIIIEI